jgi:predicted XRE-type DNA-binding protein
METKNPYEFLTDDPVKFNTWSLKSKMIMVLVDLIDQQGWTQKVAAEKLKVSQPRVSNLFKGRLDRFSVDSLLEMTLSLGYKLDLDYRPHNFDEPLQLKLKKAML